MSDCVFVRAQRISSDGEAAELVLTSLDGTGRVWRRRYNGKLALAFDAHELGLLEALQQRGTANHKEVQLDVDRLRQFRFVLDSVSA